MLGIFASIFLFIGSMNTIEYFFAGKNYLRKYNGVVKEISFEAKESYQKRRIVYYAKTIIRIENYAKKFQIVENMDIGGYLPAKIGDTITLYVKRWYQYLYNYTFKTDVYYAEINRGLKFSYLREWKNVAFSSMCFGLGSGFLLLMMFLESRNISLSNLFLKKQRQHK